MQRRNRVVQLKFLVFAAYWPRPDTDYNVFFVVDQVAALTRMGHEVDVFLETPPWRPQAPFLGVNQLGLDACKVRIFQVIIPRFPGRFGRWRWGALLNIWLCGRFVSHWLSLHGREYDKIIIHSERNIGLSSRYWNAGRSWPAVMIVHGPDDVIEAIPVSFRTRHFGRKVSSALNKIILVGSSLRQYVDDTGYQSDRIQVILNGFRPPYSEVIVAEATKQKSTVNITCVGRLIYWKGQDDLIEALAKMREVFPNLKWHLDIIGSGVLEPELRELVKTRALTKNVTFHGAIPHEQVFQHLERSDIFVLPSWKEAFGVVYLEAMATYNAVVGCYGNGADDILTDRIDGRLVPPRDTSALSETLAELIGNEDGRTNLATAAKETVRRFSWRENARAVIEALDG